MMKFLGFESDSPRTPYAPTWKFKVGTSFCDNINTNTLSKFLLKKENEIKKLPVTYNKYTGEIVDGYTGLGKNSTTSKYQYYNILTWDHPEIKKLENNITKNIRRYNLECKNETPNELYAICWFNILRFSKKIKAHQHSTDSSCYLSGHFNVQVNDTSTCYMCPINQLNDPEVIDIKNKVGEMTLFPSYIFHYTTPHYSFTPRITIAFDISLQKQHSNWKRLV